MLISFLYRLLGRCNQLCYPPGIEKPMAEGLSKQRERGGDTITSMLERNLPNLLEDKIF